jgi:hypothetical protein
VNTQEIGYMVTYGLSATARSVEYYFPVLQFLPVLQYIHCFSYIETEFTYCGSTRVSNELGAGNPDRAKNAMLVTLKLSVILSFTIVLALTFGHNTWAGFFIDSTSNYAVLIEGFASMTPLLAISIVV